MGQRASAAQPPVVATPSRRARARTRHKLPAQRRETIEDSRLQDRVSGGVKGVERRLRLDKNRLRRLHLWRDRGSLYLRVKSRYLDTAGDDIAVREIGARAYLSL